jgi:hypothetical protein
MKFPVHWLSSLHLEDQNSVTPITDFMVCCRPGARAPETSAMLLVSKDAILYQWTGDVLM